MSELRFQTQVARYLTDPRFRSTVSRLRSEVAPGDADRLQTDTDPRLLLLDSKRADLFARLLVANRLSKAVRALPWTAALLGAALDRLGSEFNSAVPPKNSRVFDEARAFARFLIDRFEHCPPELPFLPDVARYELASLELRLQFDGNYVPHGMSREEGIQIGDDLRTVDLSAIPVQLGHSRILAVQYDVCTIGELVESGRPPVAIDRSPCLVLFYMKPSGELGNDLVNAETEMFIRACDGRHSLGEVLAALAPRLGIDLRECADGWVGECAVLFASLVERRVLGYREAGMTGRDSHG
jgi:hypothetical protein